MGTGFQLHAFSLAHCKSTIAGRLVELPGLTKRREKERQLCLMPLD